MGNNHFIADQDSGPTDHPHLAGSLLVVGVAISTIIIQIIPGCSESLQWHRVGAFFNGFTSHLTHWSWDHLLWDVAAFLILAFTAVRLIPNRFPQCLLFAAVIIPIEIAFNQPQFETYRGLSGIDSALFGLIIAGLWKMRSRARWLAVIGLVAFLSKSGYEILTGDTFFVEQAEHAFIPATSAHVTGILCGLIAGLFPVIYFTKQQG